jgi:hypothetical protein
MARYIRMGVTLPSHSWESPHGFRFEAPYVSLTKNINTEGIKIFESAYEDKAVVIGVLYFYRDEQARRCCKLPIHKEEVRCFIPYAELGNPFQHLYAEVKKRFPDAVDNL